METTIENLRGERLMADLMIEQLEHSVKCAKAAAKINDNIRLSAFDRPGNRCLNLPCFDYTLACLTGHIADTNVQADGFFINIPKGLHLVNPNGGRTEQLNFSDNPVPGTA